MEEMTRIDTSDVPLPRDLWDVPVKLVGRHYAAFSSRLDRQLRKLEARWAHIAGRQPGRAVQPPCGETTVP